MASLTIKHYLDLIDTYISNVNNSNKTYYFFLGKATPWLNSNGNIDETAIVSANASVNAYEQSIYKDIVFGKKINAQNLKHLIPRYDWVSGTIYDTYDQNDENLYNKKFYVVTNNFEVYKCLGNNRNSPSTVKPSLTATTGSFMTADGYLWKYMYTIDSNSNTNFTSTDYIPVVPDSNVSSNAISGTIDYIKLDDSGFGYDAFDEGFLQGVVNNYAVILANTASAYDDTYTNSSIYLKAGFGAGQIRKISSYSGINTTARVSAPFDTYTFITLDPSSISGSFNIGQLLNQKIDELGVLYTKGYFNIGDTVNQSDTGVSGTVVSANSTTLGVVRTTSNTFSLTTPIFNTNQSGSLSNGTVSVTANSAYVNAVANTEFTNNYVAGDYICVGNNTNNNIRRIIAVNNSVITVDTAFNNSLTANIHFKKPYATEITSIIILNANGTIANTNLNSVKISYSNTSIIGQSFINGEKVDLIDVNGINQSSNGTISYANSSTIIISDIQGTFVSGLYVKGESSLQSAYISSVDTFPSITLSSPRGSFISGQNIFARNYSDLSITGSATVISSYTIPNALTEYIISPTVTISGDGDGALAYSQINTSNNTTGQISDIIMINNGQNYTYANVVITANSLHGSNAKGSAIVSPINGHGYNAYEELGSKYLGISVTIDTIANENYKFNTYSKFRQVGIIEDPLFADATLTLDSFDRVNLGLANTIGNNFIEGEIVYQSNSSAVTGSGIVVTSNSSFLQLKNYQGNIISNNTIKGIKSLAVSNVISSNIIYFSILSNNKTVIETSTNASAIIEQRLSNNTIRISNISPKFIANTVIYDPVSNAYANVVSITTSNNTIDSTFNFGNKFTQTLRITLSNKIGNYQLYEEVVQDISGARGIIISTNNELDISYTSANGTFTVGDVISDSISSGQGIITYANSSFMRLTNVSGQFLSPHLITNISNTSATIANVYPVLVLSNIDNKNNFTQGTYNIVGQISGATAINNITNTIILPELVRNSGRVTYIENVAPFYKTSNTAKEVFSIVMKV